MRTPTHVEFQNAVDHLLLVVSRLQPEEERPKRIVKAPRREQGGAAA